MRSCGMSRFKEEYVGKCLSFLEIDGWLAGSSKKKRAQAIITTEAEYMPVGCLVNNREKQPTVQCTKDPKEPHLSVEVFGMAIPDPLITEAIQQSSYYPKYLKMVAANTKKTPHGSASMQPATKRATPKKPTTTTPVKQSKPAPSPTKKPSKRELPQKIRKGKPTFHLVDEEDEAQQESKHQKKLLVGSALLPQRQAPVGGVTIRDPVSETTPELHEKRKDLTDQFILARRDQSPPDSTTGPSSQPDDDTSDKEIHESSSTSDSERTESDTEAAAPKGDKDQDEVDTSTITSECAFQGSGPWFTSKQSSWSLLHQATRKLQQSHISPEITPFIALQLEWRRLEHADRTKLDDSSLKGMKTPWIWKVAGTRLKPQDESMNSDDDDEDDDDDDEGLQWSTEGRSNKEEEI
ncbi:hypothetical protein Tco_0591093 [Tanacetum coccineum]